MGLLVVQSPRIGVISDLKVENEGEDPGRCGEDSKDWQRLAKTGKDWQRLSEDWQRLSEDWQRLSEDWQRLSEDEGHSRRGER